jgi:hypothetical protein
VKDGFASGLVVWREAKPARKDMQLFIVGRYRDPEHCPAAAPFKTRSGECGGLPLEGPSFLTSL